MWELKFFLANWLGQHSEVLSGIIGQYQKEYELLIVVRDGGTLFFAGFKFIEFMLTEAWYNKSEINANFWRNRRRLTAWPEINKIVFEQ